MYELCSSSIFFLLHFKYVSFLLHLLLRLVFRSAIKLYIIYTHISEFIVLSLFLSLSIGSWVTLCLCVCVCTRVLFFCSPLVRCYCSLFVLCSNSCIKYRFKSIANCNELSFNLSIPSQNFMHLQIKKTFRTSQYNLPSNNRSIKLSTFSLKSCSLILTFFGALHSGWRGEGGSI